MGTVAVVIPLREGAYHEVMALLRKGTPLDPEAGGLERYWAFLSEREAVLVFEGSGIDQDDGTPWEDPARWSDGSSWMRCAETAPRLARSVHSWWRPPDLEGVFFGPLPGPGDSEGGDTVQRPGGR